LQLIFLLHINLTTLFHRLSMSGDF